MLCKLPVLCTLPSLQVMDKLDESRKKKIEEMAQEAIRAGPGAGVRGRV